ncbi:MAG: sulfite exporter TauE/SafE family protein [Thermoleophilaceae bacterium]|nr:sulfite exporter TauE/SafE family protein [Thermoleophilaceae bacterium]
MNTQRNTQASAHSPDSDFRPAIWRLAAVGVVAGVFSSLFGVGGGTVIVPLLILWFGFNEKVATGTSLLAIVLIAAFAAFSHGYINQIDFEKGLLIGVPAVGGVLIGTSLQQRMSDRLLSGLFAILLVLVAVLLVVD